MYLDLLERESGCFGGGGEERERLMNIWHICCLDADGHRLDCPWQHLQPHRFL